MVVDVHVDTSEVDMLIKKVEVLCEKIKEARTITKELEAELHDLKLEIDV